MTKFNIGDVVINIYNPSTIGTISSFSSTTYSMLLFTGGYFTFPVSLESMYRLATSEEIPGSTPTPAKGEVYNLDYPVNAKNGETITIKASVVNVGGTSGDFSLRVIAAPQIPLVTRYVGLVAAYRFTALVNLHVTMPSSGSTANLGVQCIRHT